MSTSTFMPSPVNKTRARKPNFSNDEIDCLLELVNQNRDILLSNDHKADSMRQKQLLWQQIAEDVTLNGDRLCQRDANDVRQKWKDLVRWANKDMVTLQIARENNQSLPSMNPYTKRVIRIKNSKENQNDCSMYSSPSQVVIRNIKTEAGDMEGDNGGGDFSSSSGLQSHTENIASSHSNPKFSSHEIRCLIAMYDNNKSILKTNDNGTIIQKNDTWKSIAKFVSEIGTNRTATECQQKWMKFLEQAKKEEIMEKEEEEKGGSFPKSPFTDLILKVDRTEAPVVEAEGIDDEFWDSLEDNTENIGFSIEATEMTETISQNVKSAESIGGNEVHVNETTNGLHEGVATPHSYSTHRATPVQSTALKLALSNRSPHQARKRKRPMTTFMNSSRLSTIHTRSQHSTYGPLTNGLLTNGSLTNGPLNHAKERQDFESRRHRLELEKMALENAVLQSQREKVELEKQKLRLEMANLEQEKEKILMEKEVASKKAKLLEKQLMGL